MIAAALDRGIDVIGELELAWRAIPNRFLAVTGTNGKTTTVELLGHVYRTAGEPVAVAGNVGTPLSSLAGEIDPAATVVCEASSFQLEDSVAFAPECAVFLNLAPDHLDRHARPRVLPGGEAADLRQPGQRRRRRLQRRRAGARRRRPRRLRAPDRLLRRRRPRLRGLAGRGDDLLRRRAAARRRRARPLRRAQRRQRDGRRRGGAVDGDRPRRGPRGAAQLRRGAAPARAGRRDRRRPLRQRLEGDQRRLRDASACAPSAEGGRPRDPRRQRQGRGLRRRWSSRCASPAPPST